MQICSGVLGALAVFFGAIGAHYLTSFLDDHALSSWETAVDYHLIHSLLLFIISRELRVSNPSGFLLAGACLIFAGVLMFSGSIYLMTLDGPRWLWSITPIGGMVLILGWCTIICEAVSENFFR